MTPRYCFGVRDRQVGIVRGLRGLDARVGLRYIVRIVLAAAGSRAGL